MTNHHLLRRIRTNLLGSNEYEVLNVPRCRIYDVTGMVGVTGTTAIRFDSLDYDTDGMATIGNPGTITCKTEGLYLVNSALYFSATTGSNRDVYLRRVSTKYGTANFGISNEYPVAATPVESSYVSIPFYANYSNYGAPFPAAECWMDSLGLVHVTGLIKYAFAGPFSPTFGPYCQLPAGYRPANILLFSQVGDYSGGNLCFRNDIQLNGDIGGAATSGVGWMGGFMSLSGITFAPGGSTLAANSVYRLTVQDVIQMAAGDTVQTFVATPTAANLNPGGTSEMAMSATLLSTL